jgi:hypothetical protein
MNRLFIYFLVLLSISACNKSVSLSAWQPAPITVPRHIQKITLVNRTLPESKIANVIEGVLTGELPFQDKNAVQASMNSLLNSLSESSRFQSGVYPTVLKGSGSGGLLPMPLDWPTVERICRETQADAVLALETYDSDFIVTNAEKLEDQKQKDGTVIKTKVYTAQGVATIKLGFRLYDMKNRVIIDQHQYNHGNTWNARGSTAAQAALALIAKNDAVMRVSESSGYVYGKRIVPMQVWLSRRVYSKGGGNPQLKAGARAALVNDWDNAIRNWEQTANSGSSKSAGKACYNLAIAYEVQGDFEKALQWARRGYSQYGFKPSRQYVAQLEQRVVNEQRLKEQME